MKIKINRLDPSLPLPNYQTAGSAGFDFYARETLVIPPHSLARIPTNLVIATPAGYSLLIFARSSLASKKGLMLGNSVGVVDSDYCGPKDEIQISVYNFTDEPTTVEKGERLAQGLFVKYEQAEWLEEEIAEKNRGGFGSTGQ